MYVLFSPPHPASDGWEVARVCGDSFVCLFVCLLARPLVCLFTFSAVLLSNRGPAGAPRAGPSNVGLELSVYLKIMFVICKPMI